MKRLTLRANYCKVLVLQHYNRSIQILMNNKKSAQLLNNALFPTKLHFCKC